MKKFLLKSLLFLIPVLACIVTVFSLADGFTDPFYMRFATPSQTSLIIGTSRAAQGLQPAVLNEVLGRSDLFNYAFTMDHSPYGPTYLKSIQRKLKEGKGSQIFIITADPWSVSSSSETPNDIQSFRERKEFLGGTFLVNMRPNLIYLLRYYNGPFIDLLRQQNNSTFLHDDGWLEVNITMDTASVSKRIKSKLEDYSIKMSKYQLSTARLAYLEETISFLQTQGTVYLVRMPVHPELQKMDDQISPDFSEILRAISKKTKCSFLDLKPMNGKFQYTDGMHLYKDSGAEVSEMIGSWIFGLEK